MGDEHPHRRPGPDLVYNLARTEHMTATQFHRTLRKRRG